MPLQDRQLDFEDFSSDTEKLSAILKRAEVSSQKHKLCYEYYRARKFALLYPSILCCNAVGILGFVVTTDTIKRHMKVGDVQVEDILTLVIGFLGFFVGMNMLFMNQWDFGSRESMHLSALVELENLGSMVRFWKMDRRVGNGNGKGGTAEEDENEAMKNSNRRNNRNGRGADNKFSESERKALGVVEAPDSHKMALVVASGKALKKAETEIQQKTVQAKKSEDKRRDLSRFSVYNGAYHQINRSCKSEIPNKLNRPFDLFESRLECMSLGHLGVVWDTRMRRNQIMRLAAVEIYNEITGYWLWPFGTPDIEHVIDKSMKRVARLISKDYRAPIKVQCCGFTIFRCCCRKRNPKSNLLHDIWDGMEDRERDMMGARRGAGGEHRGGGGGGGGGGKNLLENDAYEAEQRLKQYDDRSYYSQDQSSAYTEEESSYAGGLAVGNYDASRRTPSVASSRRSNQYDDRSYYSRDYSRDQEQSLAYLEEGDSYAGGLAIGNYDASSRRTPSAASAGYPKIRGGDTASTASAGYLKIRGGDTPSAASAGYLKIRGGDTPSAASAGYPKIRGGDSPSAGYPRIRGGNYSIDDSLTRGGLGGRGWDEASESQYG